MLALLLAVLSAVPGKCVIDPNNILSANEQKLLEMVCERIDQSGNGQLMIGITRDLEGHDINTYGNLQFKEWKIGHKGKDDGVLMLLAMPPAQRGIRFEIGYGLEGRLNDGKVMSYWRENAKPLAASGKIFDALMKMSNFFEAQMAIEKKASLPPPPPAPQPVQAPQAKVENPNSDNDIAWGVLGGTAGFVALAIGFASWRSNKRKREEKERQLRIQEAEAARRESERRAEAHLAAQRELFRREQAAREAARPPPLKVVPTEEPPKPASPPPSPPVETAEARRIRLDAAAARQRAEEQAARIRAINAEARRRREQEEEEERVARRRRDDDSRSSFSWSSSDSSSSSSSSDSGGFSGGDGGSSGGGGGSDSF
jgi:uncharacterized membrane protein YgcG